MTAYQFSQPWLSKLNDTNHAPTAMEFAHLRDYLKGIDSGTIPLFNPLFLNAIINNFTAGGNVNMNGFKLTSLAAGTTNGDSIRYEQLIGLYLLLTGGTLTGTLNGPTINATTNFQLKGNTAIPILQVITNSTSTGASTTGTTFITSNLSATITPKSTTSAILMLTNLQVRCTGTGANAAIAKFQLQRSGTTIYTTTRSVGVNFGTTPDIWDTVNFITYDSPSTTSSRTYEMFFALDTGTGTISCQDNSDTSSIILIELGF